MNSEPSAPPLFRTGGGSCRILQRSTNQNIQKIVLNLFFQLFIIEVIR
jgi:hypothetical protein